ncbi:hypothetical protein G6F57_021450 [Rhizopus arrhizus]|nr:hypothetical protein G6F23_014619 [Rhizopus arrhizus]KAG1416395.1 hypothetical protein G6F58_005995 [Rhizopus delemar]KAG0740618.1 hypothetical protein G6F24_016958 [Rhizopus arrhizus]KAG0774918.1 hypothetical protein G6F22_013693 [Rhizopus arrhizus]KAG0778305.1 hypothetical protein G6F21_013042 [Rhizopus arrhizus]
MHSFLVFFGLLSAFMLISSLPLGPATLEKRQLPDTSAIAGGLPATGGLPVIGGLLGGIGGNSGTGGTGGNGGNGGKDDDDDDDDDDDSGADEA